MNSQRFLIFLIFLPLISGCVFPTGEPFESQTPEGTGVIIDHFGPDLPDAYSGEEVKFILRVRNTGSVKAENGFAELLGLDQVWYPGRNTFQSPTGEVFPDELKCRHTSKGITLLPEDPDSGITGGEDTCTWRYIAPEVLPGLNIHSKPRVRFFYSYRSSTIKTVTLVSREELKVLQEQGKSLPLETYSKTKSPITLDIETASPIRIYGNQVQFPIVITIRNVGGGTVCSSVEACKKAIVGTEGWYNFDLDIFPAEGMRLEVCSQRERIVLIGNNPQSISCKITADTTSDIGIIQKNIELRAEYGYFIDKTADVFVYPSAKI